MKNVWLLFFCLFYAPLALRAQAFGNTAIFLPNLPTLVFDVPFIPQSKPLSLSPQWGLGTGFQRALSYRFWWVCETNVTFGEITSGNRPSIATALAGTGVRYDLFQNELRPHVGLQLHYLHLLGKGTKSLGLKSDWPIWVGLRPSLGLEWIFYQEMGLVFDMGLGLYVNINEPFMHTLSGKLAYAIYF